ncbi:MAG: hypothetical protein IAE87_11740 [Rhodobacteraceae bacterium]|nr:hypothetical protein [Paracoccaceae bacterium]
MADAPTSVGWEGLLGPGETILWQGRPAAGIDWRDLWDGRTPFGLVFAGFALFWIAMAYTMTGSQGGVLSLFPLFGLPFLFVGLYLVFGRLLWDAHARARTHYTLTNRAAFVATELFGRRNLERYPLGPDMRLTLEDGIPGTVWFAVEEHLHTFRNPSPRDSGGIGIPDTAGGIATTGIGGRRGRTRSYVERRRIGFVRITEARQVYGIFREALSALAGPEPKETPE